MACCSLRSPTSGGEIDNVVVLHRASSVAIVFARFACDDARNRCVSSSSSRREWNDGNERAHQLALDVASERRSRVVYDDSGESERVRTLTGRRFAPIRSLALVLTETRRDDFSRFRRSVGRRGPHRPIVMSRGVLTATARFFCRRSRSPLARSVARLSVESSRKHLNSY